MKHLVVLVAVVVAGAFAAPALAQNRAIQRGATATPMCTMQNLAGTYVFESKGSSAVVSAPVQVVGPLLVTAYAPAVVVGRMTVAADGSVEGIFWAAFGTANSGVEPVPWHGEISDFENCSGVITYTIPPGPGEDVGDLVKERFVVVDGGQELRTVMTDFVDQSTSASPPFTWNTVVRRVNNGNCAAQALRGDWVMTCQSLHPNPKAGVAYAAEAAMARLAVNAEGEFKGSFDTRIGSMHLQFPISGNLLLGEGCTFTGEMQAAVAPGKTTIAKGVLFGEGKEFLAIAVATADAQTQTTQLNAYDSCRGIRIGR